MRALLPLCPPLLLAAPACGTEGADTGPPPSPGEETAPDSPSPGAASPEDVPFGGSHRVPHPVGAYEHEFDGEADVVYTVDGVTATAPGRVDFTLEVEVPELGRVFGMANVAALCQAEGAQTPARGEDLPDEMEAGSHTFPLWCEVPEGTEVLRIVLRGGDVSSSGPVG
ncbi:hypothetical protein [Nocardiopsis sp. FR4]|uniref:hypothetical protein n=1 Tax=Nocardiopsis sp. FR4 TaxID=2605985 RepID=UPI0013581712|nr:hypothetical protein [Nocardiopsis sp. FR4]